MTIKSGETIWVCLACEHDQTVGECTEHILMARCDRCGSPFLKARKVVPTEVHGTGMKNKMADLGLALLMEAQEPDKENK